jgi:hypothetical protein
VPPTPSAPLPPLSSGGNASQQDSAVDRSQVFGIVSPSFGGTTPKSTPIPMPASMPQIPPTPRVPPIAAPPPEDVYAHAHGVTTLLIHAWETFDQRGGDWTRVDVQHDLSHLRALLDGYIQRGGGPETKKTGEVTE